MVTTCFSCGKEINENSEENEGKRFLLCKQGCGFTAKGSVHVRADNKTTGAVNFEVTKKEVKKMGKKKQSEQTATVDVSCKVKVKGDGKPTIVKRIQELMDKKTPEEIAETISREFGKKYNTNRVKETIKYITRRKEKGKA